MIDFKNASFLKLSAISEADAQKALAPIMLGNEQIVQGFHSVRDMVIFTDQRLVTINIQGLTGKKKDYTSLPYSRIQCWSIETAGVLDLDSELDLWFAGLGHVRLEFKGSVDIRAIGQIIARYVLK